MTIVPSEELTFDEDDPTPAELAMWKLTGTGKGWVNLVPEVEPGHDPAPRNLVVAIFSARGDAVPLATWAPAREPGHRPSLGIEHGSGPKAIERLAERDLPLPPGWLKVVDHPRRGLVVGAAVDATVDNMLWWLLTASHLLSTVPLTGSWMARVFDGD